MRALLGEALADSIPHHEDRIVCRPDRLCRISAPIACRSIRTKSCRAVRPKQLDDIQQRLGRLILRRPPFRLVPALQRARGDRRGSELFPSNSPPVQKKLIVASLASGKNQVRFGTIIPILPDLVSCFAPPQRAEAPT